VHLLESGLTDNRPAARSSDVHEVPLEATVRLIHPGQFAVGHLPCSTRSDAALSNFRKVFIRRDLRDSLVSLMRWTQKMEPPVAGNEWIAYPDIHEQLRGFMRSPSVVSTMVISSLMRGWVEQPDVLQVRFETLLGDDGPQAQSRCISELADWFGLPDPGMSALEAVLDKPTRTWSGGRSRIDQIWDADVERAFQALGGRELQDWYGYPPRLEDALLERVA
jgi:hypothetical protein